MCAFLLSLQTLTTKTHELTMALNLEDHFSGVENERLERGKLKYLGVIQATLLA
jgi:hypothetical protein